MASIFIFAFMAFIVAPNACVTVIIGTSVVIITINWSVSTSRVWVAVVISTCIIVITRNCG